MKTAISIPDPLFEAADRLARKLGISRSELIQRAVTMFLAEQSDEAITEALNQVYGEAGESSGVDPVLEKLQLGSLPEEDW